MITWRYYLQMNSPSNVNLSSGYSVFHSITLPRSDSLCYQCRFHPEVEQAGIHRRIPPHISTIMKMLWGLVSQRNPSAGCPQILLLQMKSLICLRAHTNPLFVSKKPPEKSSLWLNFGTSQARRVRTTGVSHITLVDATETDNIVASKHSQI